MKRGRSQVLDFDGRMRESVHFRTVAGGVFDELDGGSKSDSSAIIVHNGVSSAFVSARSISGHHEGVGFVTCACKEDIVS